MSDPLTLLYVSISIILGYLQCETLEQMKDMCLHHWTTRCHDHQKSIYIYIILYILYDFNLKKQNDSTAPLKQKGRFSTGRFLQPQKPRTKGMPQSCLMTSVSWVWPVPWHAWCRGTAMDGEQLQLSSRRPEGVHCLPTRFAHKMRTKPLKIMKILSRCGINQQFPMGKDLLKQLNVFEIESTFWSVRHCDIVTGD